MTIGQKNPPRVSRGILLLGFFMLVMAALLAELVHHEAVLQGFLILPGMIIHGFATRAFQGNHVILAHSGHTIGEKGRGVNRVGLVV
jgi:hypothetical protein